VGVCSISVLTAIRDPVQGNWGQALRSVLLINQNIYHTCLK